MLPFLTATLHAVTYRYIICAFCKQYVETVEILSSLFLISNLLPTTIAHLGPIASLQTKVLYLFAHL